MSQRKPERSQRRLWGEVSNNLPGDFSEIYKSALFEMSLRRCLWRLGDASEMRPFRLSYSSFYLLIILVVYTFLQFLFATVLRKIVRFETTAISNKYFVAFVLKHFKKIAQSIYIYIYILYIYIYYIYIHIIILYRVIKVKKNTYLNENIFDSRLYIYIH